MLSRFTRARPRDPRVLDAPSTLAYTTRTSDEHGLVLNPETPLPNDSKRSAPSLAAAGRGAVRSHAAHGLHLATAFGLLLFCPGCAAPPPPPQALVEPAPAPQPRIELRGEVYILDHLSTNLTPDSAYPEGSLLMLWVSLDSPTTVHLLRDDVELWSGPLPAGESKIPASYPLNRNDGSTHIEVRTDHGATASVRIGLVS